MVRIFRQPGRRRDGQPADDKIERMLTAGHVPDRLMVEISHRPAVESPGGVSLLGAPMAPLYRWSHLGIGPKAGRVGRHLRYLPADVISWFRKQQAAGTMARVKDLWAAYPERRGGASAGAVWIDPAGPGSAHEHSARRPRLSSTFPEMEVDVMRGAYIDPRKARVPLTEWCADLARRLRYPPAVYGSAGSGSYPQHRHRRVRAISAGQPPAVANPLVDDAFGRRGPGRLLHLRPARPARADHE